MYPYMFGIWVRNVDYVVEAPTIRLDIPGSKDSWVIIDEIICLRRDPKNSSDVNEPLKHLDFC